MSLFRAFLLTVTGTALGIVAYAALQPSVTPSRAGQARHALLDGVFVTDQVALDEVKKLGSDGYSTLVNLRPDGEEAQQPSASQVADAAKQAGLTFAYIPTPHGDIPEKAVTDLAHTLETAPKPIVLYCRSGKRASRVWALAEATRSKGANAVAIAAAVRSAGQPVDDLLGQIDTRIAARAPSNALKAPQ